jgi:hypothetical protein
VRSSSFFKNIELVFHISSSLVIIWCPTKDQPPRLPGTAQIVISPGVVWWFFLTDNNTTPTKLFCFVLCCWLGCGNCVACITFRNFLNSLRGQNTDLLLGPGQYPQVPAEPALPPAGQPAHHPGQE